MNTGRAVGGPRDGVRLSAGVSWDGRVAKRRRGGAGSSYTWYAGRYVWAPGIRRWMWEVERAA